MIPLDVLERFEAKYVPEPNTGCWLWFGAELNYGYGQFRNDGHALAHRWSYSHFIGPIPEGLIVRHRCDTPCCVNPDHLELGTYVDNMADKVRRGRHENQQKTQCKNGHPFDETNTRWDHKRGRRQCRACGSQAFRKTMKERHANPHA